MFLSLAALGAASIDSPLHFDLSAGDAAETLNEFSRQSNLQVLFDFNLLRGTRTHAVHGDLEPATALATMLADTNLVVEFVNERTVTVSARPQEPKKPRTARRPGQAATTAVLAGDYGPPKPQSLAQVLISTASFRLDDRPLGAQLIDFSRVDIDQSGLATAQDFLRTLPQVFGGGPSDHTILGREAGTNSALGSGVNLRGLNAGATLVLIDGHRMAPSGTQGAFLDVSNIPLTAVDRIEIMPDGASAQYGADAVGGVVNFVMRDDFQGVQTQLRGGTVTDGAMGQQQFGQMWGTHWDSGKAILALEYYHRDALPANDRAQNHSDLRPFGGDDFDEPIGSPGTITDGTSFWLIPKGQNGTSLTASQLIPSAAPYLYNRYQNSDVTPDEARWNVFGRAEHSISDDLNIFAEGIYSQRHVTGVNAFSQPLILTVPIANPYYVNPAGGTEPITVLYGSGADFGSPAFKNRIDTGNFTLGANMAMARNWNATTSLNYAYEAQHQVAWGLFDQSVLDEALSDPDPLTSFNPFGDGSHTSAATLTSIGRTGLFHLYSKLWSANLASTGPLFGDGSESPRLTVGSEYRHQSFETIDQIVPVQTLSTIATDSLGRNVAAAFGELRIPLFLPERMGAVSRHPLELSAGIRYEHFSDVGGVTVPKYGLRWQLLDGLSVRATWSRAFKPPNLPDVDPKGYFVAPFAFPEPTAAEPQRTTTALVQLGSNTTLAPESARIWTLGTDYRPTMLPGLSVSLTYFDIAYAGRVDQPDFNADILQRADLGYLVRRGVSSASVAAICSQAVYAGAGSCQDAGASGTVVDLRLQNLTLLKTRGVDFLGKYELASPLGEFSLGMNGTFLTEYSQANSPTTGFADFLNTQNNPLRLRLRGSVAWRRSGWDVATYVNYYNSYRDVISVPARTVGDWATVDLQLAYEPRNAADWLLNTRLSLSMQNLFDTYPPFLNNSTLGLGYDQENADLTGRFIALSLRKSW